MNNLKLEKYIKREDDIIKDLKTEIDDNIIKQYFLKQKKTTKQLKIKN